MIFLIDNSDALTSPHDSVTSCYAVADTLDQAIDMCWGYIRSYGDGSIESIEELAGAPRPALAEPLTMLLLVENELAWTECPGCPHEMGRGDYCEHLQAKYERMNPDDGVDRAETFPDDPDAYLDPATGAIFCCRECAEKPRDKPLHTVRMVPETLIYLTSE
jgi:hypothetical protein